MMNKQIDRLILPNTAIDLRPNLATMGAEKKLAMSWTMFEIKGMKREIEALY